MNYCPLNIYTGYTFLSSSLKVEDVFSICDKLNYSYFGICDLNNMHAYSEIESLKHKYHAKPLYGASITYFVNEQFPLTLSLYIKNEIGYKNLIKIISSYPHGISLKELSNYKEGLICIVPTLSNKEIRTLLIDHDLKTLQTEIFELKDGFTSFYLGIEIYQKDDLYLINLLRTFIQQNNLSSVAFNKHLYLHKSDAIALTILNCIKNDTKTNIKAEEGPYYFVNEKGLKSLYLPQELANSLKIAEECQDFIFNSKRGKLLSFSIHNKKDYIRTLCLNKLQELKIADDTYQKRIDYELDIIDKMGYLDYFLIVKDYVDYAKTNHIPVGPGRGSAAASLVSYLLNITEIDPLQYNLFFERFLNPERTSMPDIDIDFADYARDDIIKYIGHKYGQEKTASIITFQTLGAKQSLRDIVRVFSYNNTDINNLCSSIGHSLSLKDAYKKSSYFRELIEDEYFLEIVKLAKKIEGLPRQRGIHAAGIIINNDDLTSSIPLHNNEDGSYTTQFEAPLLENLGFLKMDILSLTNLTIIEQIENYIHFYCDKNFSIKKISYNDLKTFDILNKGLTCGIFQLESKGITKSLKEVKINDFNDIVAILALYRPGPMDNIPLYAKNKNYHLKVDYIHPLLEPILSPTYGVIVYQEQIMQIVQVCAGFTLGKADILRRAISKKDSTKLQSLKKDFINGCKNKGLDSVTSEKLFDLIYKFANYGFNKAHTVSYAVISYQMAYLKANYPQCFYACILNHFSLQDPRISELSNELKYFNLHIHLPSINKSKNTYVIKEDKLFIPFTSIRGLNKLSLQQIENIQQEKIDSFATFMKYAEEQHLSDEAIISLINSGCFDELHSNRQTLRRAMSTYRLFYQNISNEGILTKQELESFLPIIEDEKEDEFLKYELEYNTLNILLSGSLFSKYQDKINSQNIIPLSTQINNLNFNNTKIAVIIKKIKIIKTKKQEAMATLIAQDDTSLINVVVFPRIYIKYLYLLKENNGVIIAGHFKKRDDELSFISDEFISLEEK